jgi:hypothetical protein
MLGRVGATLTEGNETESGDINIADSVVYGATLDIPLKFEPGANLELHYSYQPTRLQFKGNTSRTRELFDLAVHYMSIGVKTD